jgi:hypothetical protein
MSVVSHSSVVQSLGVGYLSRVLVGPCCHCCWARSSRLPTSAWAAWVRTRWGNRSYPCFGSVLLFCLQRRRLPATTAFSFPCACVPRLTPAELGAGSSSGTVLPVGLHAMASGEFIPEGGGGESLKGAHLALCRCLCTATALMIAHSWLEASSVRLFSFVLLHEL